MQPGFVARRVCGRDVQILPVPWLTGLSFLLVGDQLVIPEMGSPDLNRAFAEVALAKSAAARPPPLRMS